MVVAGATDQAIGDALQLGRMSVNRHRKLHIEAPARAVAQAASKGIEKRQERQELIQAAENGELDPTQYLSLASIVHDLARTGERLERVAAAAEAGGQYQSLASLSAQQLRSAEVRGRLGAVGGYAPRQDRGGGGESPMFSLTINYSGGRRETLDMMPIGPEVVDPDRAVHIPALTTLPPLPGDEDDGEV